MKISSDAYDRAKKIRLIIFDVDGVLTNGKIYIGERGEFFKAFNCRDGFGITAAHKLGMKTAIITGRDSIFTTNRANGLGISSVKQGQLNKRNAYKEIKAEFNLTDEEIAYIADDIIDLPVFVQVGFRAAVGDADAEVKKRAHFIAENIGGSGAAREAIEFILKAQGKWSQVVEQYTTVEDSENNFANIGQ
ncbi:MAG: HAD hydrolase family protein [Selenomonadaceae bacterium]|nr:HAD hydrolase family protein [Selenomonadaceae bacterium]